MLLRQRSRPPQLPKQLLEETPMLLKIPLLTCLVFAAVYPLCFWISAQDPLKNDFHKFHLGLPNFVGGMAVVGLLFMDVPLSLKIAAVLWKTLFIFLSYRYWKKGGVNPRLISVPCVLGVIVFQMVQNELAVFPLVRQGLISLGGEGVRMNLMSTLAGLILCSSIFSLNLGHWYLNVHGLPLSHLLRSVKVLQFFLIYRAILDAYFLTSHRVFFKGERLMLLQFTGHLEGFLLWIAIFFGTVFPLISLYFVKETLRVKSTQSATGILYVILIAVLIGDITYKYYLIQYGIAL